MKKSPWPLITVTTLSVVLAGCGGASDSQETAAADTRAFEHLFGTTEIPVDPQRVVVLDSGSVLEAVVALDVSPVGTIVPKLTGDFPDFIAEGLPDDVIPLGNSDSDPDMEQILNADPDLIIVAAELGGQKEKFDAVSDLAPTIAVDDTAQEWKSTLSVLGDALGASERAEKLLADYEDRVQKVRQSLGDKPGTLSIIRARADRLNYMAQNGAFVWATPAAVGFNAPQAQNRGTPQDSFFDVSLERTDLIEADRILILTDQPIDEKDSYLETLRQNPLLERMSDRIEVLPSSNYLFGNILMANAMLDYLESSSRS